MRALSSAPRAWPAQGRAAQGWATRGWATQSWATRGWATRGWATRGWATRSWATRSWATQSWATRGWATRGWATRGWATRSWATQAWATQGWATRGWATRGWARQGCARRWRVIGALVAGALALSSCGWIRETQREQLFRPASAPAPPEGLAAELEGLERWWVDVEGGRVEAWYLPPAQPSPGPAPAVLFAHGNAERIEPWATALHPYRQMGLAVLLPEYRGYGRSSGVPGEAAIVGDFAHFYDRLVDRADVDGARIVLHGRSLGGGVVGVLSDRRRCAALILESTFTNVPDLASRWWAPMGAITDRFDTRDVLMRSSTPTLILHGVDDDIVPFQHAVELHRVAWDSRLVAYRARHSDIPRTEEAYWSRIEAFLREAEVVPPPAEDAP